MPWRDDPQMREFLFCFLGGFAFFLAVQEYPQHLPPMSAHVLPDVVKIHAGAPPLRFVLVCDVIGPEFLGYGMWCNNIAQLVKVIPGASIAVLLRRDWNSVIVRKGHEPFYLILQDYFPEILSKLSPWQRNRTFGGPFFTNPMEFDRSINYTGIRIITGNTDQRDECLSTRGDLGFDCILVPVGNR